MIDYTIYVNDVLLLASPIREQLKFEGRRTIDGDWLLCHIRSRWFFIHWYRRIELASTIVWHHSTFNIQCVWSYQRFHGKGGKSFSSCKYRFTRYILQCWVYLCARFHRVAFFEWTVGLSALWRYTRPTRHEGRALEKKQLTLTNSTRRYQSNDDDVPSDIEVR